MKAIPPLMTTIHDQTGIKPSDWAMKVADPLTSCEDLLHKAAGVAMKESNKDIENKSDKPNYWSPKV